MILACIVFSSCRPAKYIGSDQKLVHKTELVGVDKDLKDEAEGYIRQKANSRFLGFAKIYLGIYNLVNTRNGKYKENLKTGVGEPPAILDSTLVVISSKQITAFLRNKGFFNANVDFTVDSIAEQKVAVNYFAKLGNRYFIRNVTHEISDSNIRNIYFNSMGLVIEGKPYDTYVLEDEQTRIADLMKDNGYREFEKPYVRFIVDSNLTSNQVDIILRIDNPPNKLEHTKFTINESFITILSSTENIFNRTEKRDTIGSNYFIDQEDRYKAKVLAKSNFMRKGEMYKSSNAQLTFNRYADLGIFRFIRVDFVKNSLDSSLLDVKIDLTPAKRQSIVLETEGTVNGNIFGLNIGTTYQNKNLFKGAELFEIKLRAGIETQPSKDELGVEQDKIRSKNLDLNSSITFPRILSPFDFNLGRYGIPRTKINFGLSYEDRIQFTRSSYSSSISYEWRETQSRFHTLTPINIGFIRARLEQSAIDELTNSGNILALQQFRSNFVLGSQYAFVYNAEKLRTFESYLFYRIGVDVNGNTLNLYNKLFGGKKDTTGVFTVFGVPYSQYVKPELDVRLYRNIGGEKQMVYRINVGVGYAYGNSQVLPFEKQFIIGGSNSLRAWRTRQVGPGTFRNTFAGIDSLQQFSNIVSNLIQQGEIKIEGNIEYRFKIVDNFFSTKLRGATFLDFGNVWNFRASASVPEGEFKFGEFYKQVAIGTGLGLRFDLGFFLFRTDFGLKLRDPQFAPNERWVIKNFGNKNFKAQFPNYRFINLNFGIGYPF